VMVEKENVQLYGRTGTGTCTVYGTVTGTDNELLVRTRNYLRQVHLNNQVSSKFVAVNHATSKTVLCPPRPTSYEYHSYPTSTPTH
jgi:hypothetical protein